MKLQRSQWGGAVGGFRVKRCAEDKKKKKIIKKNELL